MHGKFRRPKSTTPEERAEALADQGYMASGNSYVSVATRENDRLGKVPYYRDPEKCDHGISMCPTWECIESWSLDYRVLLHRTGAGRDLAQSLGIDATKFALVERTGIEHLRMEDFLLSKEVKS